MASLSQEQKSALIGVKVMLNPTVSCKLVLCNDDGLTDADKTLLPSDVVSTYMLKNLFFHCIEDNAKDTTGRTVTTGQILWGKNLPIFVTIKSQQLAVSESPITMVTTCLSVL